MFYWLPCGPFWKSSLSSSGVSALEGPYFLSRSNIETVSNCCFVNLNPFPLVPQATYQVPSPIESGKIKEKSFSGFVVDFNTSPSSLYLIDASVFDFLPPQEYLSRDFVLV